MASYHHLRGGFRAGGGAVRASERVGVVALDRLGVSLRADGGAVRAAGRRGVGAFRSADLRGGRLAARAAFPSVRGGGRGALRNAHLAVALSSSANVEAAHSQIPVDFGISLHVWSHIWSVDVRLDSSLSVIMENRSDVPHIQRVSRVRSAQLRRARRIRQDGAAREFARRTRLSGEKRTVASDLREAVHLFCDMAGVPLLSLVDRP